jgi:hypothetical protein
LLCHMSAGPACADQTNSNIGGMENHSPFEVELSQKPQTPKPPSARETVISRA